MVKYSVTCVNCCTGTYLIILVIRYLLTIMFIQKLEEAVTAQPKII